MFIYRPFVKVVNLMLKRTLIALSLIAGPAFADAPVVKDVAMHQSGDQWRFDVTLFHADTGWDDYADGWRIVDEGGNVLGQRNLAHPHVNEQPFTRSLSGVRIPANITRVGVQARDNISGWSTKVEMFNLVSGTVVRPTR